MDGQAFLLAMLGLQATAVLGIGGILYRLGNMAATQDDHERRLMKLEVIHHGKT